MIQVVGDHFSRLKTAWLPFLRIFSRMYEMHISEDPREKNHYENNDYEVKLYENSQRLFTSVRFSSIESIYEKALTSLTGEEQWQFLAALSSVAK